MHSGVIDNEAVSLRMQPSRWCTFSYQQQKNISTCARRELAQTLKLRRKSLRHRPMCNIHIGIYSESPGSVMRRLRIEEKIDVTFEISCEPYAEKWCSDAIAKLSNQSGNVRRWLVDEGISGEDDLTVAIGPASAISGTQKANFRRRMADRSW